ncbi:MULTISPECIES: nitrogen fixation protein NifZ [Symbiopectobacterium]|uniref:nitrogen fixation protein NifZ n=1 Tax=Symbiopectobacterium TaxID=801 RepID=UPI001A2193FF|nr:MULTISPECIES: nitrogen fixation protein NifZ [Symbiopectobacterium]MBG6248440.1 nitrogen fixation protein NifZ [Candidatus Symbiopectobacterium sp. PLON1]MBT9429818.1 nitrogen fixation protein NifZ [Candidatus Symbiopectobacterium endolongispinus]
MMTRFEFGDAVRVVRPLRNDGTVAGLKRGELLVRRGSIGYVREWGTFLQDQLIYQVHFLEMDRIVGCRAQELIAADAPWYRGEFQYGDLVICLPALAVNGLPVVSAGQQGQVQATDQGERGEYYTVVFGERWFQVPSSALELCEETS